MRKYASLVSLLLLSSVGQSEPATLKKTFPWKNLSFTVASKQENGKWSYVLEPQGLKAVNDKMIHETDGPVRNCEIADLDGDGWPEILVTWDSGAGSCSAELYSVNAGKSLSIVGFPAGANKALGQFSFKDQHLVFCGSDTMETHYRLVPGEALKTLKAEGYHPSSLDFGLPRSFSVEKMDRSIDPRRDFSGYSSGRWNKNAKIPSDALRVSAVDVVGKVVGAQIKGVLEDARSRSPKAKKGTPLQQVGDFYASGLDTERINQLGLSPIQSELDRLSDVDSPAKFAQTVCQWNNRVNDIITCAVAVGTDQQDRSRYSIYLADSELGMNLEHYTKPQFAKIRQAYLAKLQTMLELSGLPSDQAKSQAQDYFNYELRLAAKKLTPAQRRDPRNAFRKMSFEEAVAAYPYFDLPGQLATLKLAKPDTIWVLGPEAVKERHAILAEGNWKQLQAQLRLQILQKCSPYLSQKFLDANYQYNVAVYGNVPDSPRQDKVTSTLSRLFGHPLSQLYVAKHFPAERRKSVEELLHRVRREFRQRIVNNQWLQPQTRQQALEKLDAVEISVGYPDQWIDHSSVDIRRDDYIGNFFRVNDFLAQRSNSQYGKPVKVDRFAVAGSTLPIDINAAYSSDSNRIEIAAAILQPPFFDPQADMPVNLGTLGAVIGHEMTHGFDSSGRNFDAKGNVRNWWTEVDAKNFERENTKLIDQANGYQIFPGLHLNGALESGENLADVGGVALGYAALQTWLRENPQANKTKDGLTPEQRYFVAWAQLWSEKGTESLYRQLNLSDGHPPGRYRQSQPMRHEPGFFKAFHIGPGDPLWLDPQKRIHVW